MAPDRSAAAYCPECEHLLRDGDVAKIVGRHMDGVDPTFLCPVCDGEIVPPARAPEDAPIYEPERESSTFASPGRTDAFAPDGSRVVVDGAPPLDLGEVREEDRITVHYRVDGYEALQTKSGTILTIDRAIGDAVSTIGFETDAGRRCDLDPAGTISTGRGRRGRVVRVRVTR